MKAEEAIVVVSGELLPGACDLALVVDAGDSDGCEGRRICRKMQMNEMGVKLRTRGRLRADTAVRLNGSQAAALTRGECAPLGNLQ